MPVVFWSTPQCDAPGFLFASARRQLGGDFDPHRMLDEAGQVRARRRHRSGRRRAGRAGAIQCAQHQGGQPHMDVGETAAEFVTPLHGSLGGGDHAAAGFHYLQTGRTPDLQGRKQRGFFGPSVVM